MEWATRPLHFASTKAEDHGMVDLFEHANQEHDEISKRLKTLPRRWLVLLAVTQAAFEGANIFEGVARKLIVLRPKTFR
jgi:hypothetical protein